MKLVESFLSLDQSTEYLFAPRKAVLWHSSFPPFLHIKTNILNKKIPGYLIFLIFSILSNNIYSPRCLVFVDVRVNTSAFRFYEIFTRAVAK